jgi:hypothetical protein
MGLNDRLIYLLQRLIGFYIQIQDRQELSTKGIVQIFLIGKQHCRYTMP